MFGRRIIFFLGALIALSLVACTNQIGQRESLGGGGATLRSLADKALCSSATPPRERLRCNVRSTSPRILLIQIPT